jgi:hypothetical protein
LNSIESQSHCNEVNQNWLSQERLGQEAHHAPLEHFVDADKAAEFLSLSRKHILKLAILGVIPAHPLGLGQRKTWRFLLSELRDWMLGNRTGASSIKGTGRTITSGSPRKGGH